MTKLRKQRRRKVYRHNVNRKRLRNKIEGVGKIQCKEIENAWDNRKSIKTNLQEMGLSHDPNTTIKILSKTAKPQWEIEKAVDVKPTKSFVVEELESDAKAPRAKMFRLPKSQVEWITYLMDKYGKDYKAMAKDRKNYYQETWKQLRAKVKRFKSIPEQYSVYLMERSLEANNSEDSDVSDDE